MNLDLEFKQDNYSSCNGCSILKRPGEHCIDDWSGRGKVDILFVSDSLKSFEGDYTPFRGNEYRFIMNKISVLNLADYKVGFTSSVKCPNIKIKEIQSEDIKICRKYLISTVKQYAPTLVFACGKLANNVFYGKNVDDTKSRGKVVDMEFDGFSFKLVSIFHPYQAVVEPKNDYLFTLDINNAIDEVILKKERKSNFTFIPILSIDDLYKYGEKYITVNEPISVDIETTGLNFLKDTIHTIALSILDQITLEPKETISFPIEHKDFNQSGWLDKVIGFVKDVMANPRNRKILQKAKFDLKFLLRYGVSDIKNIWDTKIMQHFYNEDVPKSLGDLVNYYYPNEI